MHLVTPWGRWENSYQNCYFDKQGKIRVELVNSKNDVIAKQVDRKSVV